MGFSGARSPARDELDGGRELLRRASSCPKMTPLELDVEVAELLLVARRDLARRDLRHAASTVSTSVDRDHVARRRARGAPRRPPRRADRWPCRAVRSWRYFAGELGRGLERLAAVGDAVELLVLLPQALEDLPVSSTLGSSTSMRWKRRASARSFSRWPRYSWNVVEPMQRSRPEASAGLSRFDASMLPPLVAPAPTMVWISSMKRMRLGCFSSALMTALMRSSKSPRNLVPASSAPMSSA